MRRIRLLGLVLNPVLLLSLGSGVAMAQAPDPIDSLKVLRHRARPLLIFTPSENDPRFGQQTTILTEHLDGLIERQVVGLGLPATGNQVLLDHRIWATINPEEARGDRTRFHVSRDQFVVILLGRDGGEKQRWTRPVNFEELRSVVDSMPGRQDEMRDQARRPPANPQPQR